MTTPQPLCPKWRPIWPGHIGHKGRNMVSFGTHPIPCLSVHSNREREQLNSCYNTTGLAQDGDQPDTSSIMDLCTERDQCRMNRNQLERERDKEKMDKKEFQERYTTLTTERDRLRDRVSLLTNEKVVLEERLSRCGMLSSQSLGLRPILYPSFSWSVYLFSHEFKCIGLVQAYSFKSMWECTLREKGLALEFNPCVHPRYGFTNS